MDRYQKDFIGWAKVAEEIEKREECSQIDKAGIICWVNLGVNIGSEEDGKGANFTRPALIIAFYGSNLALIAPLSSKIKKGQFYRKIIANGNTETIIINQIRVIDRARIGNYIDEIDSLSLERIRNAIAGIIVSPPVRNKK